MADITLVRLFPKLQFGNHDLKALAFIVFEGLDGLFIPSAAFVLNLRLV